MVFLLICSFEYLISRRFDTTSYVFDATNRTLLGSFVGAACSLRSRPIVGQRNFFVYFASVYYIIVRVSCDRAFQSRSIADKCLESFFRIICFCSSCFFIRLIFTILQVMFPYRIYSDSTICLLTCLFYCRLTHTRKRRFRAECYLVRSLAFRDGSYDQTLSPR